MSFNGFTSFDWSIGEKCTKRPSLHAMFTKTVIEYCIDPIYVLSVNRTELCPSLMCVSTAHLFLIRTLAMTLMQRFTHRKKL